MSIRKQKKLKKIHYFLNLPLDKINWIVYNNNCQGDETNPTLNDNRRENKTMCNANDSIISKVEELMDLRKLAEELNEQMEAITDEIKAYMGSEETMMAGSWKVTYKETVSRRMDTKALKNLLGDALEGYYKTIVTRPFKVI